MSKPSLTRLKLSPLERDFFMAVAEGADMVDACAEAYSIKDKSKAAQMLPSLLDRAGVKQALEGLALSGVKVEARAVEDTDGEMLKLCVSLAKSPTSNAKEKLDAVRAYAQIRSKLAPQGVTEANSAPMGGEVSSLLDGLCQERFTDTDKREAYKPFGIGQATQSKDSYGLQSGVEQSQGGAGVDGSPTPGHTAADATHPHCHSPLESAQKILGSDQ